jgi:dihydroxyacid dehydratase/phosphogluconate dehydratase
VLDLGKEIKKHVQNDNMLAWQYNTVGVSDGITMGGEGTMTPLHPANFELISTRNALLSPNA